MKKLAESLLWAQDYLRSHGYELHDQEQRIRTKPWSQVIRFKTSKGFVYLKSMSLAFSNEHTVIQFLYDHISKNIPEIIASNTPLSCFLMADAGEPLREVLKDNFRPEILCQALKICAQIQIDTIPYRDQLLLLGVHDWRLEKIPFLYQTLMDQEDLLKSDGLTSSELQTLYNQLPKIKSLCDALSSYGIPETIEHGDFHDHNILVQKETLILNDWGDSSISHPFFSCVSALKNVKFHYHWKDTIILQKAYLDPWRNYGSEERLFKALKLAEKIRPFVFALKFSAVLSCQGGDQPDYKGYVSESLRDFMRSRL